MYDSLVAALRPDAIVVQGVTVEETCELLVAALA